MQERLLNLNELPSSPLQPFFLDELALSAAQTAALRLPLDGLVQDAGHILGAEPVGVAEGHQRLCAPALLYVEMVEDDVPRPRAAFLRAPWIQHAEVELGRQLRWLLGELLFAGNMETVAGVRGGRRHQLRYTFHAFRNEVLHDYKQRVRLHATASQPSLHKGTGGTYMQTWSEQSTWWNWNHAFTDGLSTVIYFRFFFCNNLDV